MGVRIAGLSCFRGFQGVLGFRDVGFRGLGFGVPQHPLMRGVSWAC